MASRPEKRKNAEGEERMEGVCVCVCLCVFVSCVFVCVHHTEQRAVHECDESRTDSWVSTRELTRGQEEEKEVNNPTQSVWKPEKC